MTCAIPASESCALSATERIADGARTALPLFRRLSMSPDKRTERGERDITGLGYREHYIFKDNPTEDDSINELPLHVRILSRLRKNGIETIRQLRQLTNWDIEDMQFVGPKQVATINKALAARGFLPLREE